ncbi:MAG TPA: hypothetical protein VGO52_01185 [Hyphomonadaceae bacterium]|jgi:hypothetical protein|nr:hypothetical protein [Hyphomonadaceae bacterium]
MGRMLRQRDADWFRRQLGASVRSGLGAWIEDNLSADLAASVFRFSPPTTLDIHERGLAFTGEAPWQARFDELTGVSFLPLRGLMLAQKAPREPVQLRIETATDAWTLTLPLYHYTTLASLLLRLGVSAHS